MLNFIHLSDLHISKNNKNSENRNTIKIVDHLCNKYKDYGKNLVVIITGDIVDDGKESQYKNAVEILTPLANMFTVLACPGNHDYGPCGNFYTEKSQAMFQKYILDKLLNIPDAKDANIKMEDLYPMVNQLSNVLFVGIDSVVDNEDEFAHFEMKEILQQRGVDNIVVEEVLVILSRLLDELSNDGAAGGKKSV
jgi:predicted MPP superfamily phosphohydrolase